MLDLERNGFEVDRLITVLKPNFPRQTIYGGILALEMGMGKTLCVIATCLANRIPTLVVAPALTCVQWVAQIKQYAPQLSATMVYCEPQSKIESLLLNTDIVVVSYGSKLVESVMKRVKRVVVDESHEVFYYGKWQRSRAKVNATLAKFLNNLRDYPNVKNTWLVSGTPFGDSERMLDPAFGRQMNFLLSSRWGQTWNYNRSATIVDVKALVMRMQKAQTYNTAAGVTLPFMPIPKIEYRAFPVALNPIERELYNIAGCVDGWAHPHACWQKTSEDISDVYSYLHRRFALRKLILGEQIYTFQCEVKKRLDEHYYNPDSEAPDLFFAKAERMTKRIAECCKVLQTVRSTSYGKIDAVLGEIRTLRSNNSNFKAVIITESINAGDYIKYKLGKVVGVMQRFKGRASIREQRELLKFQMGEYDVLVCSSESVRIGTNLQQACAIYFIDTLFNYTEHQQACARISRCGTKHSKLTATFVYVKDTLSEQIYKYHEDRRNGKTIKDATARFKGDEPHEFSAPYDFRTCHFAQGRFSRMKFSFQRMPDPLLHNLMSSDINIDDMFEEICKYEKSDEMFDVQITLTIEAGERPALYDVAKQIVVSGKTQTSFRLVFDIPKSSDFSRVETLTTNIRLTEKESEILSSINDWHKDLPSVPIKLQMILERSQLDPLTSLVGSIVDMKNILMVTKSSCSSCKWCGWRKVNEFNGCITGCFPSLYSVAQKTGEKEMTKIDWPMDKFMQVWDDQGILTFSFSRQKVQHFLDALLQSKLHSREKISRTTYFVPFTNTLESELDLANQQRKAMGVLPYRLRYDKLTHDFFASFTSIYQKVLVKLTNANVNDTIRFKYKSRQYETFIREIIPVGLDWFAVAYVVEPNKPESTIIIEEHSLVDMKRAAKVANDALSFRDIVRMLRNDAEKTESLKAIMLRSDIDDARKLELAAALV